MPDDKETLHKMLQAQREKNNENADPQVFYENLMSNIRQVLYNSGKSLHQIYQPYQTSDKRGK